jgi:hypothetical protein
MIQDIAVIVVDEALLDPLIYQQEVEESTIDEPIKPSLTDEDLNSLRTLINGFLQADDYIPESYSETFLLLLDDLLSVLELYSNRKLFSVIGIGRGKNTGCLIFIAQTGE